MKTLIIIRHSKAEQTLGQDIKRNLTERGLHDADMMAKMLLSKGYKIDKIFSSPSERTKETAAIFAKIHEVAENSIKFFDYLYLGDTLEITEAVNWLQENIGTLAIIGHNPGVTNFVNDTTLSKIAVLPTSGIAIIKVDATDWSGFDTASKALEEVYYPQKML